MQLNSVKKQDSFIELILLSTSSSCPKAT